LTVSPLPRNLFGKYSCPQTSDCNNYCAEHSGANSNEYVASGTAADSSFLVSPYRCNYDAINAQNAPEGDADNEKIIPIPIVIAAA
jgi:hypothetical protein